MLTKFAGFLTLQFCKLCCAIVFVCDCSVKLNFRFSFNLQLTISFCRLLFYSLSYGQLFEESIPRIKNNLLAKLTCESKVAILALLASILFVSVCEQLCSACAMRSWYQSLPDLHYFCSPHPAYWHGHHTTMQPRHSILDRYSHRLPRPYCVVPTRTRWLPLVSSLDEQTEIAHVLFQLCSTVGCRHCHLQVSVFINSQTASWFSDSKLLSISITVA